MVASALVACGSDGSDGKTDNRAASEYLTAHARVTDRLDRTVASFMDRYQPSVVGRRAFRTSWSKAHADAIAELRRLRPPPRLATTHRLTLRCFARSASEESVRLDASRPRLGSPASEAAIDLCDDARIAYSREGAGLLGEESAIVVDRDGYGRLLPEIFERAEAHGHRTRVLRARSLSQLAAALEPLGRLWEGMATGLTTIVPPADLVSPHRKLIRCVRRMTEDIWTNLAIATPEALKAGYSPRTMRQCRAAESALTAAGAPDIGTLS